MTRVFLVDDHEIVRRGIAQLIDASSDLEVAGEAASVSEALRRIEAVAPDVAVLDVRLPDGDGIDLCREVRSRHPHIACLILTAYDDDAALRTAALAGASGYVLKDVRSGQLLDAIRAAAAGKTVQSSRSLRAAAQSLVPRTPAPAAGVHDDAGLSYRERQVLDLIAEGMTNREIGERLGLAEKTVKNYVSGMLSKLGMERRTQAAVYGAEHRHDPR
jgi:two-component system response regulator DevR